LFERGQIVASDQCSVDAHDQVGTGDIAVLRLRDEMPDCAQQPIAPAQSRWLALAMRLPRI
jgi:hypothetical protein